MVRRLELLAWVRESGAFIVEDDYTSEFRYSRPPLASLQGLDASEQVIYVGTLNKALFPGLRIGYAVVPRALLRPFIGARYLIDRQPPTLQQAVVSEFMQQGHFAAHIRRVRQLSSRAARCVGGDVDTPRGGKARCSAARSGHAPRRIFARRVVRHRNRGGGAARRHRRPRDQPLLPRSPPAAWPDARLFRIPAAADRASGRA